MNSKTLLSSLTISDSSDSLDEVESKSSISLKSLLNKFDFELIEEYTQPSLFKSDRELRLKDIVIYIDKISKNMVKKGISLNKKYKEIIDDIRIKQNNSINKEKNLINVVDNIVNEVNTIKGMYKLI